jgi:hypothetical protein
MGSYLYSQPEFWSGFARLLDFGNTYDQYNSAPGPKQADALGLLWDWAAVSDDIRQGVIIFEAKYGSESRQQATSNEVEFAKR